jgi:hypothetical protein
LQSNKSAVRTKRHFYLLVTPIFRFNCWTTYAENND